MKYTKQTPLFFFFSLLINLNLFQSCSKQENFEAVKDAVNNEVFANAANGKPNIVVILADDVGYDVATVNGGQSYSTPNIDKLAKRGLRFTQCYSSPLCSPSRVAFITGKYNFRNYAEWGVLAPTEKTFATLLRDAGYATFVAGKWGYDGGDTSIRSLGFQKYSLFNAIQDDKAGSRYKNPTIYQNGAYLPSTETQDKYGDDIFTDNILTFIKQNRKKNFFVYYPITLCHAPYSPTPDDAAFATWDPLSKGNDTAYFPSMVKYMDKKIGQIVDSLKTWNLFNNTIIMYVGDNGTPHHIFYSVNDTIIEGQKSETTTLGTRVPLIVSWPAKITPRQVNNNMVDFTDFLPTLADAAGVKVPKRYGTIDGQSFYNQLINVAYTPREWVFNHYKPGTEGGNIFKRWIHDTTYKLYDMTGAFYNMSNDPYEKSPIPEASRNTYEKELAVKFQQIMDGLQ